MRKDFIIDGYQVVEARAYGADAVLLIVAALNDEELEDLWLLAEHIGMHALVEVHNDDELDRAYQIGATLIGINNRDLHSFTVRRELTGELTGLLPKNLPRPVIVSESGIFSAADVAEVRNYGADAVLVGEALVTAPDIGAKVRELAGA